MFKKILMLTLTFIFLTMQANAATNNSLKAIFDDLNYSLTVEWDQKDKAFYNSQIEKFNQKIAEARAQGATQQEIMQYAVSEVKNEALQKELQTTLSLLQIGALSSADAQKILLDTIKKSRVAGASWTGSEVAPMLLAFGLVAIIVVIIYATRCKGEIQYTGEYETVCNDVCDRDDPSWCYTECHDEEITICVETPQAAQ